MKLWPILHTVRMGHFLSLHTFTLAELSALRLNGDISPAHEMWEESDDWRTRSWKVLSRELHPLVLTGLSAAWAHGVITEPSGHTASTITVHRIRAPKHLSLKIEQRNLLDTEMLINGHIGVTRPLRTITDLLRSQQHNSTDVTTAVSGLMNTFDISYESIRSNLISMPFYPYVRQALHRLEDLRN